MRRGVQVLFVTLGLGPCVRAQLSPTPCPVPAAFHEMCRDEYVMLMTWKKAAAGEIIYNKCPPNASGEGRQLPLQTLAPPSQLPTSGHPASRDVQGVGKTSALMPIPVSIPLQALLAAAVSSVHRVWPTGDCPALLVASPMNTATCTCQ